MRICKERGAEDREREASKKRTEAWRQSIALILGEFSSLTLEYLIQADIRDVNFWVDAANKKAALRRANTLRNTRLAYIGGDLFNEELTGLDWLIRGEERAAQASPLIEPEEKKED